MTTEHDVLITSTPAPGILQLTLNRPKALNALNKELLDQLLKIFLEAKTNRSIKALLITGEGKAFCAGADISQLAKLNGQEGLEFARFSFYLFFFLFSETALATHYGTALCKKNPESYTCYIVKRGDTWDKLFPNPEKKDLVMRINRLNMRLHRKMVIAIPKNIDTITKMSVAPFAAHISPPGKKIIKVSLKELAWGAYDSDGDLLNWGPISGGRGFCSDIGRGCHTPKGRFTVYSKQGAYCVSTKFPIGRGGAPMPYCMFFHGGYALHGSYKVPGHHASHGCVRLFIDDAKWLNREFTSGETVRVIIEN